jgi:hypothetical protein
MLDSVGRWLLRHFDYRVCGLLTLVLVMAFLGKRKWAQGGWPPILETLLAAASFLFILGGLLVMVVFLFTKPPAIDDLSPTTLSLIGILCQSRRDTWDGTSSMALSFRPSLLHLRAAKRNLT